MNPIQQTFPYRHFFSKLSKKKNLGATIFGILTASGTYFYYQSNKNELNRSLYLLANKYEKIREMQKKWDQESFSKDQNEVAIAQIFSRAEIIKAALQDTHFVFIHGQTAALTPLIDCINRLAEKNGYVRYPYFKYIRMPQKTSTEDSIRQAKIGNDLDIVVRTNILAVDACFQHRMPEVSAYSFLEANLSVLVHNHKNIISSIASTLVKKHIRVSEDVAIQFGKKIEALGEDLASNAPCGNLWLFCIPKTLFTTNIAYRCHIYGYQCLCHEGNELEILQKLQDGLLDASTECYLPSKAYCEMKEVIFFDPIPQYRLNLSQLHPEKGMCSFMLTPFSQDTLNEMQQKVIFELDHLLSLSQIKPNNEFLAFW